MPRKNIHITLDEKTLKRIDRLKECGRYINISRVAEKGILEAIEEQESIVEV